MDLIDRDKAIEEVMILRDTLEENVIAYMVLSGAYDTLMGIPSVREWIPCSERMPKEEGAYLVTEVSYGELYVSKGYYVQENGEHIWRNDTYEYDIIDPIAWMPLPEPYREDKE